MVATSAATSAATPAIAIDYDRLDQYSITNVVGWSVATPAIAIGYDMMNQCFIINDCRDFPRRINPFDNLDSDADTDGGGDNVVSSTTECDGSEDWEYVRSTQRVRTHSGSSDTTVFATESLTHYDVVIKEADSTEDGITWDNEISEEELLSA